MSQFKRIGAFVGTVAAVATVVETVRPRRGTEIINNIGWTHGSTLKAAMGETPSRTRDQKSTYQSMTKQSQRGGKGSVNIQAAGDISIRSHVIHVDHNSPYSRNSPWEVLQCWLTFPLPFVDGEHWEREFVRIAHGLDMPDTWDDVETLGRLIAQARDER